jgi:hypothetical protein
LNNPLFPAQIINAQQQHAFRELLNGSNMRPLYHHIRAIHQRNTDEEWTSKGHSLDHDLAVAAFAHAIAYSRPARSGQLQWASITECVVAAALMHSYDRYRRSDRSRARFAEADVRAWIRIYLPHLSLGEYTATINAVIGHDKPNKGKVTNDPTVGDILADADKLANLMFYTLIRSGQYEPNKPTVILDSIGKMSEGSNYKFHRSAIDDLYGMLEWVDDYSWFVTDEAKELARALEPPLRFFVETHKRQFAALGLDKLP